MYYTNWDICISQDTCVIDECESAHNMEAATYNLLFS